MNDCAKCGTTTDAGQFYRFDFGIFWDQADDQKKQNVELFAPGGDFELWGSDESYFCHRCLLRAAMREEQIRAGIYLSLGLFSVSILVAILLDLGRGFWVAFVALLMVALLCGAAIRRSRQLRAVLIDNDIAHLREAVSSSPSSQHRGEEWAIDRRRQALKMQGADLFSDRK